MTTKGTGFFYEDNFKLSPEGILLVGYQHVLTNNTAIPAIQLTNEPFAWFENPNRWPKHLQHLTANNALHYLFEEKKQLPIGALQYTYNKDNNRMKVGAIPELDKQQTFLHTAFLYDPLRANYPQLEIYATNDAPLPKINTQITLEHALKKLRADIKRFNPRKVKTTHPTTRANNLVRC